MPHVGPTFRIGSVFPGSDDDRVRLARLLIAMQPLIAVARLVGLLPSDEQRVPADEETLRVLKVQSLGPTHEALKAFRDADRPGVFSEPVRRAPEIEAAYQRLRARLRDRKFCDQLREARNQIVYHVDCEPVREVLERVAHEEVPVYLGTGAETTADTALPVVDVLVKGVLEDRMPGWEHFANQHLWQLQADLWNVALSALGYYVAEALGTLKPEA